MDSFGMLEGNIRCISIHCTLAFKLREVNGKMIYSDKRILQSLTTLDVFSVSKRGIHFLGLGFRNDKKNIIIKRKDKNFVVYKTGQNTDRNVKRIVQ